jgi:excinuclease ABC subunit B
MKTAIAETNRRRRIQDEYNQANGITPQSIRKNVYDIITREKNEKKADQEKQLEIIKKSYNILVPSERKKLIKLLEREMLEHAKNLEFEQAVVIRDEIGRLKDF